MAIITVNISFRRWLKATLDIVIIPKTIEVTINVVDALLAASRGSATSEGRLEFLGLSAPHLQALHLEGDLATQGFVLIEQLHLRVINDKALESIKKIRYNAPVLSPLKDAG